MTQTYEGILERVRKILRHELGNGIVIHHPTTKENPLGQSGIHTFVEDVMNICEQNPRDAYRELVKFFIGN